MFDVLSLGELLIDFVPTTTGVSLIEAEAFVKAPGGAPANVAVGLARLGKRTGFMGKVGDDAFGHFLAGILHEEGVDVSALKFDREARTALAFVSLKADGERDFMFYRHPSADMRHHPDEISPDYVASAKILHHGSISLIAEPARSATFKAIALAHEAGLRISYDPNLRLPLWDSESVAQEGIMSVWKHAQIIKMSDAELEFLTGVGSLAAARGLFHDGLELLLVTRGASGVSYLTPESEGHVNGFFVNAVDTTGAGDAFTASVLSGLLDHPEALEEKEALEALLRHANACGALTTTRRGAIPALPRSQEVRHFIAGYER